MDGSKAKYRFGALSRVKAEASGVPGKRTFRLLLEAGAATAALWLEKEQLYQLALHIHEIVATIPKEERGTMATPPEPQWSGGATSIEFKVGKLALGHDGSSGCFLFLAHDAEEEDQPVATLSFWLTLGQGEELVSEALKVCAAGRPQCFLCGQPINPEGHVCPRANGHVTLA
jgi:uncharacterized repeat protein (TIGR03847 family)